MLELRPYQKQIVDQIDGLINNAKDKILVVSSTGSGKGAIITYLMDKFANKKMRCLFAVHRRTLVQDIANRVKTNTDLDVSIILPGEKYIDSAYIHIGSIQSIMARKRRLFDFGTFDVIIVDEAHLVNPKSGDYKTLFDQYSNATVIGFTATPIRRKNRGLGDIFKSMVQTLTYPDAFRDGWLVPARYFIASTPDLSNVKIKMDEYDELDLANVMNKPKLIGDAVQHYYKYANGKRAVCFAVNIKHSLAMCESFNEAGIPAAHMDANTPDIERQAIFKAFNDGEILILTNVGVLSTGVDLPLIEVVIDCQPTKSLALYMQKLGRGLRTSPGKLNVLYFDHANNYDVHGDIADYNEWTLETSVGKGAKKDEGGSTKEKKLIKKEIICEHCGHTFIAARACPQCKQIIEYKKYPEYIDHTDDELKEIGDNGPSGKSKSAKKAEEEYWYWGLLSWTRSNTKWNGEPYKDGYAAFLWKIRFKTDAWPPFKPWSKKVLPPAGADIIAFVRNVQRNKRPSTKSAKRDPVFNLE